MTLLGVCRAPLNICGVQIHMGGPWCVSQTAVCRALLNACRTLLGVCRALLNMCGVQTCGWHVVCLTNSCMQGSFECMQGSFGCMQGSFECTQGSFEYLKGSFECMQGSSECMRCAGV